MISGNVITFDQDLDDLCKVLPRLPENLPFIVLQTKNKEKKPLKLKIRPEKVLAALNYLKEFNQYYSGIKISEKNASYYKDEFDTTHLRTVYQDWEPEMSEKQNEEPEAEKDRIDEKDLNKDFPQGDSLVHTSAPSENLENLIKKSLTPSTTGKEDEEINKLKDETFAWPKRGKTALSEFSEGYYSKCFPHLFPNADGDFYIESRMGRPHTFQNWVQHLMAFHDERFKTDLSFVLIVANQYQRRTALMIGRYIQLLIFAFCSQVIFSICQQIGNVIAKDTAKDMSLKELQEQVASGSEDILKKLGYYSRVVKGSPSYWHTERKKMKALSRHIIHRSMEKEQMHIFQTFSPGKKICKKLYLEIPPTKLIFFILI